MHRAFWLGLAACFLVLLGAGEAKAADSLIPAKPARYVEDKAGILDPSTRDGLERQLEQFERDTSNQILVATFPTVPGYYTMEDFTQRTAEAWGVGQKANDNGAVFFIFPLDRRMRIEVGYGLEGNIPDATAKTILDQEVSPAFRTGDFAGGVTRGVEAILQAAKGEYQGTGRTVAESEASGGGGAIGPLVLFLFFVAILFILGNAVPQSGWEYDRKGRKRRKAWEPSIFGGSGGGSGWGGGGWGSGGSGGGFSGGGGSFGGGGASGGW